MHAPVNTRRVDAFCSVPLRTMRSTTPFGGRTPTSRAFSLRPVSGSDARYVSTIGLIATVSTLPTSTNVKSLGVCEAVLVERERLLRIDFGEHCRRKRARTECVLRQCHLDRVPEYLFRSQSAIGEHGAAWPVNVVNTTVSSRGAVNVQVCELEHRLDVLRRAAPRKSFSGLADCRRYARGLAGELLAEVDAVEVAEPAELT